MNRKNRLKVPADTAAGIYKIEMSVINDKYLH